MNDRTGSGRFFGLVVPWLPLLFWGVLLPLVIIAGYEQPSQLSRIQQQGELVIATRKSPTTYFNGANGIDGFEYQLAKRFAEQLGIKARFVVHDNLYGILDDLNDGSANMAAARLSITPRRKQRYRFSTPYQTVVQQIVYRRGSRRPRDLSQIAPGDLQVIAGSSHIETLKALQKRHPALRWRVRHHVSEQALLREIDQGEVRLTVVDSNELGMARRIYRYLRPAFDIGQSSQIAWAFPATGDGSLQHAANRFLQQAKQDGTLDRLVQHFYGHAERLNFVDKRDFQRHIRERLPAFRKFFHEAAKQSGFDWRLLAAIGYQESHWRRKAVSPTGVRGIMMLTQDTARQVGVDDRLDARQSILGGARYLRRVEQKIPERIRGYDRIWLTLAGYNVGFGHLEDARILTERQGGNPDRWQDVKQHLPLLAKKQYYKTLRYGYARGREPVHYVENIRNYFDLLVWYDNHPDLLSED